MAGANIFIIYADASGKNITLSPRLGLGNMQPDYDSQAVVSVLDGTGIEGGMMTANVRCMRPLSPQPYHSMLAGHAYSNTLFA